MPRGSTDSPYDLNTRKELAFRRFSQGAKNSAIASELQVSRDTVARYRDEYEQTLREMAVDNPQFLEQVLPNTFRALDELDLVRANAWERLESKRTLVCPECESEIEWALPDQTRAQLLNVIVKAQDQRNKLLGVLGIEAAFLQKVTNVQFVSARLIQFMQENLCAADRSKLEHFLTTELSEYMDTPTSPTVNISAAPELEAGDGV